MLIDEVEYFFRVGVGHAVGCLSSATAYLFCRGSEYWFGAVLVEKGLEKRAGRGCEVLCAGETRRNKEG